MKIKWDFPVWNANNALGNESVVVYKLHRICLLANTL